MKLSGGVSCVGSAGLALGYPLLLRGPSTLEPQVLRKGSEAFYFYFLFIFLFIFLKRFRGEAVCPDRNCPHET